MEIARWLEGRARPGYFGTISTAGDLRRRSHLRAIVLSGWSVFLMIILAVGALCLNISLGALRKRLEMARAHDELSVAVSRRRAGNAELKREIRQLQTDPRTMESRAREAGYIRPNEIVVTLDQ